METNLEDLIAKVSLNNDCEDDENNIKKTSNNYDPNWLKGTSAEPLIGKQNAKSNNSPNPIYKTISKINGQINNMSTSELIQCLSSLKLDPSGRREVLIKRLKSYKKQLCLNRVNSNSSVKSKTQKANCDKVTANKSNENFDYICVIDYEATCDDKNDTKYPHEIIEFPIILVNVRTKTIDDCFHSYVKPTINPKLTNFCIHLTGITQDQVDNAEVFPKVLDEVNKWFLNKELGTKYKFAIATDGPWDLENFLNLQCYHNQIEYPYWAKRWINIRKLFSNWYNVRRCGIVKMLSFLGYEFEGQLHCGLHDAKNIARILLKLIEDGCEVKFNEQIQNCRCQIQEEPTYESDSVTDSNVDEQDMME